MKKITLTLLGLVAFSTSALAQQEVKFGPKAGVNFATLNGDDADNAEMKIGFHIGAVAEIKFSEKFSVQPEILYSSQGAKYTLNNVEVKQNNDYISIPIMAKYYFIEGFSAELGPQVGFLMKSESKGDNASVDTKDFHKSVDFGLGVGLAYDLPMGVFFGARYNLGLAKIGEEYTQNVGGVQITTEAADIKNAVIQVSVGYKF